MSKLAAVAVPALLLGALASARAAAAPVSAADRKLAAGAFDAGVAALGRKDYRSAASRFEAADATVPSPAALRQAIKARNQGGQAAKAATLASQALDRYPADKATAKLASDTLGVLAPKLHKLRIACPRPCVPAVDGDDVHGEAAERWVVYLAPGTLEVGARFRDGDLAVPTTIEAQAGGAGAWEAAPTPPRVEPRSEVAVPEPARPADAAPDRPVEERSGLPRAVFASGVVVAVGLGVATLGSGVDTQNNPGPAAVRAACAGKGETCPAFQDGLGRQKRTNVLAGLSIGAGLATAVVGVFFTRWSPVGGPGSSEAAPGPVAGGPSARSFAPPPGSTLQPVVVVSATSAFVGAGGTF